MKKTLIITGIVVAVLIILLLITPLLFKSRIAQVVKNQANAQLNATLNFDDVNLSLIKNFPQFTVAVEGLSIVNNEPFAGDTLLYLQKFQATVDLSSLIFGKQIKINSIQLIEPRIYAQVLKDGRANWDIMPPDTSRAPVDTSTAAFNLAINEYLIDNASVKYTDEASGMSAEIIGFTHSGQGDFNQSLFILVTHTLTKSLTFKMGEVAYLNKAELEFKADLEMDMANKKYTFKENQIRLNQLFLNFDGWVAMPNDKDIEMNITLNAPSAEFKNILSMVPYIYMKDFEKLQAEGQLALAGSIEGTYNENSVPKFDFNLTVQNGMFQYPDLPTPVKNMAIDLNINCPGKDLDLTVVDLKKFHLEILNEPIDFLLNVKTPISDPNIMAKFTGGVNLAEIKNVVPLEPGVELSGRINADFQFQGMLSDIQNQRAEKLSAVGNIGVTGIEYASAAMPVKVLVNTAQLKLTAFNASLSNLDVRLGESDLRASGGLDNVLGYVMNDQTLKGTLDIQSNNFDLTPWMTQEDTSALVAVEVPDKIEFVLSANFKKIKLDNLVMANTTGQIIVKDRKAKMVNLKSNLVGGSMVSNGTYEYAPPAKPRMDFDLEFTNFSIPEMFSTFVTVQKAAPLAQYLKGNVSGKMKMNSELGDSLMPDLSTLASKGSLAIPQAKIEGFSAINKAADLLNIQELKDPGMTDFNPGYTVENGRLYFNPTSYKLGNYSVQTSGSTGFDKSMDLLMNIAVPSTQLASLLKQDLSMLEGQTTDVPIKITNTVSSPKVEIAMDQLTKNIADQLKLVGNKIIEQKKDELKDKAQEEIDKKKKEAEDKLKDKVKGLFGK